MRRDIERDEEALWDRYIVEADFPDEEVFLNVAEDLDAGDEFEYLCATHYDVTCEWFCEGNVLMDLLVFMLKREYSYRVRHADFIIESCLRYQRGNK